VCVKRSVAHCFVRGVNQAEEVGDYEKTLFEGSLRESVASPREIILSALQLSAAAVILLHNHPSGDPTPSPEDVILTRRIVEAGELLQITVFDHLILGHQRWVSMKDRRLGFK